MTKKLTVSELAATLGVSVNTTWKKIKKRGLTTLKDTVNNREITFVSLTDMELNELLSEKENVNQVNNGDYNPNYEVSETIHEGVNTSKVQTDLVSLVEKVMDYSRDMNGQIKEYIDRVIDAEKQVKLLEDSENRKDAEFHRLISENKELKLKVEELEEKIRKYESSWWKKPLFKK